MKWIVFLMFIVLFLGLVNGYLVCNDEDFGLFVNVELVDNVPVITERLVDLEGNQFRNCLFYDDKDIVFLLGSQKFDEDYLEVKVNEDGTSDFVFYEEGIGVQKFYGYELNNVPKGTVVSFEEDRVVVGLPYGEFLYLEDLKIENTGELPVEFKFKRDIIDFGTNSFDYLNLQIEEDIYITYDYEEYFPFAVNNYLVEFTKGSASILKNGNFLEMFVEGNFYLGNVDKYFNSFGFSLNNSTIELKNKNNLFYDDYVKIISEVEGNEIKIGFDDGIFSGEDGNKHDGIDVNLRINKADELVFEGKNNYYEAVFEVKEDSAEKFPIYFYLYESGLQLGTYGKGTKIEFDVSDENLEVKHCEFFSNDDDFYYLGYSPVCQNNFPEFKIFDTTFLRDVDQLEADWKGEMVEWDCDAPDCMRSNQEMDELVNKKYFWVVDKGSFEINLCDGLKLESISGFANLYVKDPMEIPSMYNLDFNAAYGNMFRIGDVAFFSLQRGGDVDIDIEDCKKVVVTMKGGHVYYGGKRYVLKLGGEYKLFLEDGILVRIDCSESDFDVNFPFVYDFEKMRVDEFCCKELDGKLSTYFRDDNTIFYEKNEDLCGLFGSDENILSTAEVESDPTKVTDDVKTDDDEVTRTVEKGDELDVKEELDACSSREGWSCQCPNLAYNKMGWSWDACEDSEFCTTERVCNAPELEKFYCCKEDDEGNHMESPLFSTLALFDKSEANLLNDIKEEIVEKVEEEPLEVILPEEIEVTTGACYVFYGDTQQYNKWSHASIVQSILSDSECGEGFYLFHVGDFSDYRGNNFDKFWSEFREAEGSLFTSMKYKGFFPVLGNHDFTSSQSSKEGVENVKTGMGEYSGKLPSGFASGSGYYVANVNEDVIFVGLDNARGTDDNPCDTQNSRLAATLAANSDKKVIVSYHVPAFNSLSRYDRDTPRNGECARDTWHSTIKNNDNVVVVSGHSHGLAHNYKDDVNYLQVGAVAGIEPCRRPTPSFTKHCYDDPYGGYVVCDGELDECQFKNRLGSPVYTFTLFEKDDRVAEVL